MSFLRERKTAVFTLILILSFLPILGAQTPPIPVPKLDELLPDSRGLHFPESSLSKASAGTLSGDVDAFMSPLDWSSIENMNSTFVLGGADEWGLSLGFARKFGRVYLGASYSGDLIDEIYRRIANKEVESLWKVDSRVANPTNRFDSSLRNRDNEIPDGLTISNNDINVIVGTGIFGLRLGFAEWIRSVQNSNDAPYWGLENSLESSLKPGLELGFNIPAGKATIKPALWAAFDIHQFKSTQGYLWTDRGDPANPLVNPVTYWILQDDQINFLEPTIGLGIGVELALSDASFIEIGLEGEGAFRLYRAADDPDPISSTLRYADIALGYPSRDPVVGFPAGTTVTLPGLVSIPRDLRTSMAPSFAFTGDITDRITLGLKAVVYWGFGVRTIETEYPAGVASSTTVSINAVPDLALGASFHLIPDHFSLHAGIGFQVFSFEHTAVNSEDPAGNKDPKTTETRFGLPSARFGGGLTINLTQAVALDAMAFSSGLDFDSTKFNLILTVKK